MTEFKNKITRLFPFGSIDWRLLLFLLLVLNVKLLVKVFAIVLFLFLDRKQIKLRDLKKNKYVLFYLCLILLSITNMLFNKSFLSTTYLVLFTMGAGYWMLMAGASYYLFKKTETGNREKIITTISVFLILNAFTSCLQLLLIIIETGSINPYTYQGFYQKYFINTGDFIRGISFDTSTTNAIINGFGIFYFLYNRKFALALLCTAALLLTGSNVTNLLVTATLLFSFLLYSDRFQKTAILFIWGGILIFMTKVSPQNGEYLFNKVAGIFTTSQSLKIKPSTPADVRLIPDSLLSPEDRKIKFAKLYLDSLTNAKTSYAINVDTNNQINPPLAEIKIPTKNRFTPFFERKVDSTKKQKQFAELYSQNSNKDSLHPFLEKQKKPSGGLGKIVAGKQVFSYLQQNPAKLLTGAGLGNFSSKIAFKATGESIAGGYLENYKYISPDFRANHLQLYYDYFSREEGEHSVINTPNSVYYQLLSEYGIIGLTAFFALYLANFFHLKRKRSFAVPIMLLLFATLFFDYWFEHLSIVILFELLMFTDIFHIQNQKKATSTNELQ